MNLIRSGTMSINVFVRNFKRGSLLQESNPSVLSTLASSFYLNNSENISTVHPISKAFLEEMLRQEEPQKNLSESISSLEDNLNKPGYLSGIQGKAILPTSSKSNENTDELNDEPEKKNKKRKRTSVSDDDMKNEDFGISALFKRFETGKKRKSGNVKSRPNFFFAIRIHNAQIHEKLKVVQETIISKNKHYLPALVSLKTLHLTLNVMTLDSQTDIEKAIDVLHVSKDHLCSVPIKDPSNVLHFKGLDTFRGQVLFARIENEDSLNRLKNISSVLRSNSLDIGVKIKGEKFTPHVTILKFSKCYKKLRKNGIKRIPEKIFEMYKDHIFGDEQITEILLCSMNMKKESDGFYKTVASLDLIKSKVNIYDKTIDNSTANLSSYEVITNHYLDIISRNIDIYKSWDIISEEEIKEAKEQGS